MPDDRGVLPVLPHRARATSRPTRCAETEQALAFRDIDPKAPTHVLVIPKVHAPTLAELAESHPDDAVAVLTMAREVARRRGGRRRLPTGLQQRRRGAADGLSRPRPRARRPAVHLAARLTRQRAKAGRRRVGRTFPQSAVANPRRGHVWLSIQMMWATVPVAWTAR